MNRSVTALAAAIVAVSLAGCSSFADKEAERRNWSAEKYYNTAHEQLEQENWDQAVKLYEELESRYPYGRYSQQAELEVAYAYYKQDDSPQSISAAVKFIKLHPNNANVDYALYIKALANFRQTSKLIGRIVEQDLADRDVKLAQDSFESFKELVTRYPDSRYADDSRARMAYLTEALARHEVKVARYYMGRGAYLAAANRAQECIVHFPHSPARREALEVMIESYDRMGLKELRDDTRRVLAKNFPDDALTAQGRNRVAPWWKLWK